ncbi:hypothetical protein [Sphingobacterium sp.]|uniref:hypothetical protein n=1 Tax=Sphingobacterium sp. TaxID=341027 RepID=UPI00289B85AE|nr:hypothetical protein [Sphingobacterium sp.]
MINNSVNWLYVLEDDLHPSVLSANVTHLSGPSGYSNNLKNHTQTFRPYFVNVVGRSSQEAKTILIQLINVSNVIYRYLIGIKGTSSGDLSSNQMRQLYSKTLVQLEVLLDFCVKFDELISETLPLTTYSISDTRIHLRKKLDSLRNRLSKSEVDRQLGELILVGLKQLIIRRELKRSEAEYANLILDQLGKLTSFFTFEVENLLYQYEFNTPEFFNYCARGCDTLLLDTPSLHTQLEILIGLEDRMNGLPSRTKTRWASKDESIQNQLRVFLKEKKTYIQQRLDLRRAEISDSKLSDEADRALINLPVTQLGLFIRLSMEKGIIPNEDVGKTFAYYAQHFRTPKTPFISAESLQKKSTNVEYATANKLKSHLIGMVNWLNEHYNAQHGQN